MEVASELPVSIENGPVENGTGGKSGKKKPKRKNKAKNTSSGDVGLPEAAGKVDVDVNSTSIKQNGTLDGPHESSVDGLSKSLDQSLNLGTNEPIMTNGTVSSSEDPNQKANVKETSTCVGKKKHRSKHRSKAAKASIPVSENESPTLAPESSENSSKPSPADSAKVSAAQIVPAKPVPEVPPEPPKPHIAYQVYESELQMPSIMSLIQKDLSEPYSIYTYRYFIHNWPRLCFLAQHEDRCVGAIVCKLDIHRQTIRRGYIAMLAVDKDYRKLKIGTTLVQKAIQAMLEDNADEVVLETEITNRPALRLYENLGFVRDKRLFHYYLNGVDALRLKLWFR
ncbi:N-alpha-acetyltransferase 30A [Uranotaenia lowii]|uniref:N-alpha-acetyltransferase 30A n=1 Tax=Uranotaenia lowii TaxID=190385 RepID=UPI00247A5C37|nr:N-alpha-acetyltransferase 30A [Uranotaenia lowii]